MLPSRQWKACPVWSTQELWIVLCRFPDPVSNGAGARPAQSLKDVRRQSEGAILLHGLYLGNEWSAEGKPGCRTVGLWFTPSGWEPARKQSGNQIFTLLRTQAGGGWETGQISAVQSQLQSLLTHLSPAPAEQCWKMGTLLVSVCKGAGSALPVPLRGTGGFPPSAQAKGPLESTAADFSTHG